MTDAFTLLDDASLEGRNTFRVAARAALLADVNHADGFAELFRYPVFEAGNPLVLGGGSNLLFAGDWPGPVLSIRAHEIRIVEDDGDSALVRAEAGAEWNDLVGWTLARNLPGLENLALIPGTVGAAPIQNIGAYGVEVRELVETVEAWDRDVGAIKRVPAVDCDFGYRDSRFKREHDRWIVFAVEFRFPKQRELRLDYAGIRDELQRMGVEQPTHRQVAEAVSRVRTAKLPNPSLLGNAGSFFKNPVVSRAQANDLLAKHPDLPNYATDDDITRKLSAAWLIERGGWRGKRIGDAGVSEQHALVLVNHGRAHGAQILQLARDIARDVRHRFDVELEPEPRIIGADWNP
ncbi:MAG: UDP-N-acetylmuramate dehydrogenase [Xanthomonadales bacterium]|nr:UDP-N-acetylmuramate dehydrogenase [Xanthomonadales bacterium]